MTTVFPPNLPPDLDDPAGIHVNDWAAFQGVSRMDNHWDRAGWSGGRRSYHWLLDCTKYSSDAATLHHLAQSCQTRLARKELDPVALDSLHITLGRVAFTDEITRGQATDVATSLVAGYRGAGPLNLQIGPLAGSTGALRFSVAPWTGLITLHKTIRHTTRQALNGLSPMATAGFRPHLSIAYCNTSLLVAPLLPTIAELRRLKPVALRITAVSLVEMRREKHAYQFTEVASLAL